jgi:hypothetical protein
MTNKQPVVGLSALLSAQNSDTRNSFVCYILDEMKKCKECSSRRLVASGWTVQMFSSARLCWSMTHPKWCGLFSELDVEKTIQATEQCRLCSLT